MTFLPLLLLAAAGSKVVFHDTIEVDRAEWRHIEVATQEARAVVNCEFEALSGAAEVRAVWITRKDLESFRAGRDADILAATAYRSYGRLRHFAPAAGAYAIAIQSPPSARAPVRVNVKISIEPAREPRYASPERRLAVILISGLFFFAVVSISAMKLRQGLR